MTRDKRQETRRALGLILVIRAPRPPPLRPSISSVASPPPSWGRRSHVSGLGSSILVLPTASPRRSLHGQDNRRSRLGDSHRGVQTSVPIIVPLRHRHRWPGRGATCDPNGVSDADRTRPREPPAHVAHRPLRNSSGGSVGYARFAASRATHSFGATSRTSATGSSMRHSRSGSER